MNISENIYTVCCTREISCSKIDCTKIISPFPVKVPKDVILSRNPIATSSTIFIWIDPLQRKKDNDNNSSERNYCKHFNQKFTLQIKWEEWYLVPYFFLINIQISDIVKQWRHSFTNGKSHIIANQCGKDFTCNSNTKQFPLRVLNVKKSGEMYLPHSWSHHLNKINTVFTCI